MKLVPLGRPEEDVGLLVNDFGCRYICFQIPLLSELEAAFEVDHSITASVVLFAFRVF